MNNLPVQPLSRQEQQRMMGQLYLLLGKQVKSYHKFYHMGDNTSVSVELAQELMESMVYTVEANGGLAAAKDAEAALKLGQKLLKAKAEKAKAMLELVTVSTPEWQTECRWEALNCLRWYLTNYDPLHLAHREADDLFYPVLVPVPEELCGMDLGLFYIHALDLENQIMAGFENRALEQLWDRLPTDTLNQCEQVILNGIGKVILHDHCDSLVFAEGERDALCSAFTSQSTDRLHQIVNEAALRLCQWLALAKPAADYLCAAAMQMVPRLETAAKYHNLPALFLF